MKYIYLVAIAALISFTASGQEFWLKRNGPVGGTVTDVEYYPGTDKIFAIVESKLHFTSDGGLHWEQLANHTDFLLASFRDVEIANNKVYVITSSSLYVSSDQGTSFTEVAENEFFSATKIKRLNNGYLIILAPGTPDIYYSPDDGANWNSGYTTATTINPNQIAINNLDQIFILQGSGTLARIFRSTDFGVNFTEYSTGAAAATYSLANNNPALSLTNYVYAVTATDMFKLNTGTNTWETIKSGVADATLESLGTSSSSFIEFSADASGMFFIDNFNHKTYTKTIAASSWTLTPTFPAPSTMEIFCASAKNYPAASSNVVFGSEVGIHKSTSGGGTLVESNLGITQVEATDVLTSHLGTLVVRSLTHGLLFSNNDGNTWTRNTTIAANTIRNITTSIVTAADPPEYIHLMMTNTGTQYRSTNGGESWTSSTPPASFDEIEGTGSGKAFARFGNTIYYSPDAGLSWGTISPTGLPATFSITDFQVASQSRLFMKIFNSVSGAFEFWRIAIAYNIFTGTISTVTAAKCTNTLTATADIDYQFARAGKFFLYDATTDKLEVSSDGGSSWTQRTTPNGGQLFVSNNGYVFISEDFSNFDLKDKLHYSRDDGANFTSTDLPLYVRANNIEMIATAPNNHVYMAGFQEAMYRTSQIFVLPNAPSSISEVAVNSSIAVIRWLDNTDSEDYYLVERSSNAGVNYSTVGTVSENEICNASSSFGYFSDTSVQAGASYRYRVTAVNAAGPSSSATLTLAAPIPAGCANTFPMNRSWSAQNSGTGLADGFPVQPSQIVGVRWLGGNRYMVSDVTGNTYTATDVEEEFEVSCTSTIIAGTPTPSSSHRVKANGPGVWTSPNSFTLKWKQCSADKIETVTFTLQASDPAPAAPVLKGLVSGTSSVALSWNVGYYQNDYIIERSQDPTPAAFAQINGATPYPTAAFTDNGPFVDGTKYYYRMRARNANASPLSSVNSNVVEIIFRKPMFVIANTVASNFNALTFGNHWADFDGDGDDDMLTTGGAFTTDAPATLHIFENTGAGVMVKHDVVLPTKAYQFGCIADFNNDGKADLSLPVSGLPRVELFRNNGDFTFTALSDGEMGELATLIKGEKQGASWADANSDGRLDILLTGSYDDVEQEGMLLFEQQGNGSFKKKAAGDLSSHNDDTFFGLWADYDNDGDADVMIMDSGGPWHLYNNNGTGVFTKQVPGAIGIDASGGFGGVWGDFNNDSHLDLYATQTSNDVIYRNNGNGTFTKEAAGLGFNTATVSPMAGDFNNDGLLDILAPNYASAKASLYVNTTTGGTLSFTRISNELICDTGTAHIGNASSDYDDNGFLDIGMGALTIVGSEVSAAPNHIYKNNSTTGNYVKVKLIGVASNKAGVGAKVTVTAGLKQVTREVTLQHSFTSTNSSVLHFGLGSETTISSISVRWPGNTTQILSSPDINTTISITQDTEPPVLTAQEPAPNSTAPITTTVSITFNEPATSAPSKNFVLTGVGDPSPTATIPTGAATKDGNKFTFTLPAVLAPNKLYEITIDPGGFTDLYGNLFAGIGTNTWRFTTGASLQINAFSPGQGNTNIAVTQPLELTFIPNITAVAGKKIQIYQGTGLLYEYDVSTTGTVSGNKYTLPAPPWPHGTAVKILLDAGAFKDASGNLSVPITGDEYIFNTELAPDNADPVITPPNATSVNQAELPAFFLAKVEDDREVAATSLHYRKVSGSATTTVAGVIQDGPNKLWRFNIPADAFDATGTQFFITAVDGSGNDARSPDVSGYHTVLIKYPATGVQIPSSLIIGGGAKTNWRIIAVPFDLGTSNGAQSVFEELTANSQNEYKFDYRLLSYREVGATREFIDLNSGFNTIDRGKGYFINVKSPVPLMVGDNATAPSNTRSNLFKMTLTAGWNMIGNPYLTAINWSDVVTLNGLTGTGTTLKKFSGSYENSPSLAPFEGGFVQVGAAVTIDIPFQGQTAAGGRTQEEFGDDEWLLPIHIEQGELRNVFGGIGMHHKADASFDQFDDTNAPRFMDFVEMNFDHPEHFAKKFAREVVRVQKEYTWEFDVTTSKNENTLLMWDNTAINIDRDIFLYDVELQVPVNMKEVSSYAFDPAKSKMFRIYYGDDAGLKIKPNRVMLGAAYPNPTSGDAIIPFSLPDAPVKMNVMLEVFDLMGRKVATLVNAELPSGFYQGVWRGENNSGNGLYTYRLKVTGANESVQSGKVMLKK